MMNITVRNITKDTMMDFNNDFTISLPMKEDKLLKFLGSDEWIIIDSPIGEELTNITELNELLNEKSWEEIKILESAGYLFNEIKESEFTIVNFNEETSHYNGGNGVIASNWWKGYVLHDLGYVNFPFEYKKEMENYVCFENLWEDADGNGWRECNINSNTYLVCRY